MNLIYAHRRRLPVALVVNPNHGGNCGNDTTDNADLCANIIRSRDFRRGANTKDRDTRPRRRTTAVVPESTRPASVLPGHTSRENQNREYRSAQQRIHARAHDGEGRQDDGRVQLHLPAAAPCSRLPTCSCGACFLAPCLVVCLLPCLPFCLTACKLLLNCLPPLSVCSFPACPGAAGGSVKCDGRSARTACTC